MHIWSCCWHRPSETKEEVVSIEAPKQRDAGGGGEIKQGKVIGWGEVPGSRLRPDAVFNIDQQRARRGRSPIPAGACCRYDGPVRGPRSLTCTMFVASPLLLLLLILPRGECMALRRPGAHDTFAGPGAFVYKITCYSRRSESILRSWLNIRRAARYLIVFWLICLGGAIMFVSFTTRNTEWISA